jgi:hypothetical protein
MAKVIELRDFTLGIRSAPERNGFVFTLEDKKTHETMWFDVSRDIADEIVAKLTGGVAVARAMPSATPFESPRMEPKR